MEFTAKDPLTEFGRNGCTVNEGSTIVNGHNFFDMEDAADDVLFTVIEFLDSESILRLFSVRS